MKPRKRRKSKQRDLFPKRRKHRVRKIQFSLHKLFGVKRGRAIPTVLLKRLAKEQTQSKSRKRFRFNARLVLKNRKERRLYNSLERSSHLERSMSLLEFISPSDGSTLTKQQRAQKQDFDRIVSAHKTNDPVRASKLSRAYVAKHHPSDNHEEHARRADARTSHANPQTAIGRAHYSLMNAHRVKSVELRDTALTQHVKDGEAETSKLQTSFDAANKKHSQLKAQLGKAKGAKRLSLRTDVRVQGKRVKELSTNLAKHKQGLEKVKGMTHAGQIQAKYNPKSGSSLIGSSIDVPANREGVDEADRFVVSAARPHRNPNKTHPAVHVSGHAAFDTAHAAAKAHAEKNPGHHVFVQDRITNATHAVSAAKPASTPRTSSGHTLYDKLAGKSRVSQKPARASGESQYFVQGGAAHHFNPRHKRHDPSVPIPHESGPYKTSHEALHHARELHATRSHAVVRVVQRGGTGRSSFDVHSEHPSEKPSKASFSSLQQAQVHVAKVKAAGGTARIAHRAADVPTHTFKRSGRERELVTAHPNPELQKSFKAKAAVARGQLTKTRNAMSAFTGKSDLVVAKRKELGKHERKLEKSAQRYSDAAQHFEKPSTREQLHTTANTHPHEFATKHVERLGMFNPRVIPHATWKRHVKARLADVMSKSKAKTERGQKATLRRATWKLRAQRRQDVMSATQAGLKRKEHYDRAINFHKEVVTNARNAGVPVKPSIQKWHDRRLAKIKKDRTSPTKLSRHGKKQFKAARVQGPMAGKEMPSDLKVYTRRAGERISTKGPRKPRRREATWMHVKKITKGYVPGAPRPMGMDITKRQSEPRTSRSHNTMRGKFTTQKGRRGNASPAERPAFNRGAAPARTTRASSWRMSDSVMPFTEAFTNFLKSAATHLSNFFQRRAYGQNLRGEKKARRMGYDVGMARAKAAGYSGAEARGIAHRNRVSAGDAIGHARSRAGYSTAAAFTNKASSRVNPKKKSVMNLRDPSKQVASPKPVVKAAPAPAAAPPTKPAQKPATKATPPTASVSPGQSGFKRGPSDTARASLAAYAHKATKRLTRPATPLNRDSTHAKMTKAFAHGLHSAAYKLAADYANSHNATKAHHMSAAKFHDNAAQKARPGSHAQMAHHALADIHNEFAKQSPSSIGRKKAATP